MMKAMEEYKEWKGIKWIGIKNEFSGQPVYYKATTGVRRISESIL